MRVALVTLNSIGVLTLINKGPKVIHGRHTDSLQIQWHIHVFLQIEKDIFHKMIEMFIARKQGQWLCHCTEGLSLQDEEGSDGEKNREPNKGSAIVSCLPWFSLIFLFLKHQTSCSLFV